ncbi:hypothetical protein HanIR_Chr14g0673231 [Helianthus annuus]|nr:hypothetical protein HanIR_Chr14g0673231 [Helianthus annuus]
MEVLADNGISSRRLGEIQKYSCLYMEHGAWRTRAGLVNDISTRRKKSNYGNGKCRLISLTNMAQQEDAIMRTIYASAIGQQVSFCDGLVRLLKNNLQHFLFDGGQVLDNVQRVTNNILFIKMS